VETNRWLLLILVVLGVVFVAQSAYRSYLDANRQAKDDWLRKEVLREQALQNETLESIRIQMERSLQTLDATWRDLLKTKALVEKTEEKVDTSTRALEEKVDAATKTLEVIKDSPEGAPRGNTPKP
jgi:hypothetical protein